MSDVYKSLCTILTTKFEIPADLIRPDVTLEELELDSLALAELSLILHEEFGEKVEDEDAAKFSTLTDVVAHIEASRNAAELSR